MVNYRMDKKVCSCHMISVSLTIGNIENSPTNLEVRRWPVDSEASSPSSTVWPDDSFSTIEGSHICHYSRVVKREGMLGKVKNFTHSPLQSRGKADARPYIVGLELDSRIWYHLMSCKH